MQQQILCHHRLDAATSAISAKPAAITVLSASALEMAAVSTPTSIHMCCRLPSVS